MNNNDMNPEEFIRSLLGMAKPKAKRGRMLVKLEIDENANKQALNTLAINLNKEQKRLDLKKQTAIIQSQAWWNAITDKYALDKIPHLEYDEEEGRIYEMIDDNRQHD